MVSSYHWSWQHNRKMEREFHFPYLLGQFIQATASLRGKRWVSSQRCTDPQQKLPSHVHSVSFFFPPEKSCTLNHTHSNCKTFPVPSSPVTHHLDEKIFKTVFSSIDAFLKGKKNEHIVLKQKLQITHPLRQVITLILNALKF